MSEISSRIESALQARIVSFQPLSGGCVAKVSRLNLSNGQCVVAKEGGQGLALEGWMLTYLGDKLPVPEVLLAEPDLLVMTWLESGQGGFDGQAETHCAELIASLHGHTAPAFGLDRDTVIGGLSQPNGWHAKWLDFFRDQRLLHMAGEALREKSLPKAAYDRIEKLAARLDRWIDEPIRPSLVHGDLWGGNILAGGGRVVGFVDPAIYYADPEIELAFGTMFGTLGASFFKKYNELRPIASGFFDVRRDLYNLYPLLVHVRLFKGGYLGQLEKSLDRFDV